MNSIDYKTSTSKSKILILGFISICFVTSACEDFLNVDLSKARISSEVVFSNDITATSAVTGMYVTMMDIGNFAAGRDKGVSYLTAVSADELTYHRTTPVYVQFAQNQLLADNSQISDLWETMYNLIYQANNIIEKLENSSGVTVAARDQLKGEALFVRAFTHFYLVNLFSDVPIITSPDYRKNSSTPRMPEAKVYDQIVRDLREAKVLLKDDYVTEERIRPNKYCAIALLARVYLYMRNWSQAEEEASLVISNSHYSLLSDLSKVFLRNSNEAIWQLSWPNNNTHEGAIFILTGAPSVSRPVSLPISFVNAIEAGDRRRTNWIGSIVASGMTYYFPYKYKARTGPTSNPPSPITEYSMVLRLAEQYLIRAEARAQQDNLSGGISDIDIIRNRAGISLIQNTVPGISKGNLLMAVESERKIEMFTEWGHRWLDLKRNDRLDQVLDSVKPQWDVSDKLYPIPQSELNVNPMLGSQNNGY